MFMVMYGQVAIMRDGVCKERFKQGDTFGAKALASTKMHTDDCIVLEESVMLAIPKKLFNEYIKPEMAAWLKPMTSFLKSSAGLDGCIPDDYFGLALAMSQKRYDKGELVLSTSNPGPATLMLVRYGSCSLRRHCQVLLGMHMVEFAKMVQGDVLMPEMVSRSPSDIRVVADSAVLLYVIAMSDLQNCTGWHTVKNNLATMVHTRRKAWDRRTDEAVTIIEDSKVFSQLPPSLQQLPQPTVPPTTVPTNQSNSAFEFKLSSTIALDGTEKAARILQPNSGSKSPLGRAIRQQLHGRAEQPEPVRPEPILSDRAVQRKRYIDRFKGRMATLPPLTSHALNTPRSFISNCRRSESVPPPAFVQKKLDRTSTPVTIQPAPVPRFSLIKSRHGTRASRKWNDIPARVSPTIERPSAAERGHARLERLLETLPLLNVFGSTQCYEAPGIRPLRMDLPCDRKVATPHYTGRPAARVCASQCCAATRIVKQCKIPPKGPARLFIDAARGGRDPLSMTHSKAALEIFSKIS